MVLSAPVVGILVTAAWAILTGGLHLDGLADCCDGLFSAAGRERRLEIMKDPRLGTFGGIGLVLILLLKAALAAGLAQRGFWLAFPIAASLGRWFILIASRQPMARPGGLGESFARSVQPWHILISFTVPLGLMIWGGIGAWVGGAAAGLVVLAVVIMAHRLLGGMTGDVFGLIVEVSEVTVLLGMSLTGLW
jgi:adenosylcobinamide-GDP ribazoletransferase